MYDQKHRKNDDVCHAYGWQTRRHDPKNWNCRLLRKFRLILLKLKILFEKSGQCYGQNGKRISLADNLGVDSGDGVQHSRTPMGFPLNGEN